MSGLHDSIALSSKIPMQRWMARLQACRSKFPYILALFLSAHSYSITITVVAECYKSRMSFSSLDHSSLRNETVPYRSHASQHVTSCDLMLAASTLSEDSEYMSDEDIENTAHTSKNIRGMSRASKVKEDQSNGSEHPLRTIEGRLATFTGWYSAHGDR